MNSFLAQKLSTLPAHPCRVCNNVEIVFNLLIRPFAHWCRTIWKFDLNPLPLFLQVPRPYSLQSLHALFEGIFATMELDSSHIYTEQDFQPPVSSFSFFQIFQQSGVPNHSRIILTDYYCRAQDTKFIYFCL
ncbi:hypothetical protein Y032_0316g2281 [Ancylostoma ceylanicum]|uniref:Uncharacterized protein n=1 Tax=Ancylostoma ceylanicum TaxID=53326 RepID=A0A016S1A3_9BILA|nr:hypothetical protein Y032_0316g2281 [Ancylostoma ceylanicum]